MAKKAILKNPIALLRPLSSGTRDEYVTESQYILDNDATEEKGEMVSIQDTLREIKEKQDNWATNDDVDGMFTECPKK